MHAFLKLLKLYWSIMYSLRPKKNECGVPFSLSRNNDEFQILWSVLISYSIVWLTISRYQFLNWRTFDVFIILSETELLLFTQVKMTNGWQNHHPLESQVIANIKTQQISPCHHEWGDGHHLLSFIQTPLHQHIFSKLEVTVNQLHTKPQTKWSKRL